MEVELADGPVAKRQKLANGIAKPQRKPGSSRLFAPYRTIGLVSPTAVPFTSVPLGKTTFQITTSVGRSLQTYDLRRGLQLVFITRPQTPGPITASVAWKDKVFGAWSEGREGGARGAWAFKRGKREAELEVPKGWREDVKAFCIFGGWIIGVCDTTLLVWKSTTYELYTTLQGISPVAFTRCIVSLPTFLNKVVVGRHDGSAEIWNVSSGKLIYTVLPPSTAYGAVTAIQPTPALSLIAIAYEKGPLLVHDVRADQTVMQLNTSSAGAPITSITFRTDGLGAGDDGQKAGVMATASRASGDVTLWDLNEGGRKAGVLRAAHADPTPAAPGGVSKIEFLSGQHTLVSSGLDNSLKTWIFDHTPFSPIPRILHQRGGHSAPVTKLEFLPSASDGSDDTGKWLMSASHDRSLMAWSLRRDNQSTELSQGAVLSKAKKQGLLSGGSRDSLQDLKFPPITAMACSLNRDGGMGAVPGKHPIWQNAKGKKVDAEVSAMTGWESVVTAHARDHKARTWFWGRKRAGRWAFPTSDESPVTSVAMSPCGTFALVGSEKGGIDMYNLQSGLHRQRFPARLTTQQAKQLKLDMHKHGLAEERSEDGKKIFYRGQGKHASAVIGLAVDNLNKTVISAGEDGKIKFWDFSSGLLRHQLDWSLSTGIAAMRFLRSSDLAAFAGTDGCVRVVDISTYKLIRELWPARTPIAKLQNAVISDLTFSPDGHWLAASMDSLVLLWDLPTGHLVDAFKLQGLCTSVAFSPTGEYLAIATKDSVGVDVWSNKALFMQVSTRHISAAELAAIVDANSTQAPTTSGEGGHELVAAGDDDEEDIEDDFLPGLDEEHNLDQLSSDLLSLSLVPRSQWQNLLHLDLIRARNKPIEPPKKPEKAPFFLPSLQNKQAVPGAPRPEEATTAAELEKERSRVLKQSREGGRSTFSALLHEASETQVYAPVIEQLKSLGPSAADIELRSLDAGGDEMLTLVQALTWLLRERRDFELGQAWMAVLLRLHGDLVVNDDALRSAVGEWRDALDEESKRVARLGAYCSGVVGYLRAARV
ncbi:rRNA-processing protein utp21 [Friedmanniomyces endolithicus]|nr:rRNA-processing protein utp21 [Friedmanniomyces endolithicus]